MAHLLHPARLLDRLEYFRNVRVLVMTLKPGMLLDLESSQLMLMNSEIL